MVEDTAHAEARNTMANRTVDPCCRMAHRLTRGIATVVAGVAAFTDDIRAGVIGEGRQKTQRRMTVTAFGVGHNVTFVLTRSHGTVVTAGAYIGDPGMIEATVRIQLKKMGGIVAVVAFGVGWRMKR